MELLRNGLFASGVALEAVLSLPGPSNEASWGIHLGFEALDAAMHSPAVLQNNWYSLGFADSTKVNHCSIN